MENNEIQQYYQTIKKIYNNIEDETMYNLNSMIFNSFDKQAILEYGIYKKTEFKPGIVDKFFSNTSNRLAFNFFYPLLRKFNQTYQIAINSVQFDQVHFEWNLGKIIVSPIDVLLISSKSKIMYFLECKYWEPNFSNKFNFSKTYLDILKNHNMNHILNFIKNYVSIYEKAEENGNLTYGSGISQNLRQIISIAINKGSYKKSSSPYQIHNYIYDINPDLNSYDIWFGNLLFYDSQNKNVAGDYFRENQDFVDKIKVDVQKIGINIQNPISYKEILKSSEDTYKSFESSVSLYDYLMHNYFEKC